jgi:hypothetical protein
MTNKYTRKAQVTVNDFKDLYSKFNLKDNPFPYNPFIEPESNDPKRNGTIFNKNIRSKEFDKFVKSFLTEPLSGDHNRIGYLVEASYAGRGNGKTALLVNLQKLINDDFGESFSGGSNKTFAVYLKGKSGTSVKFWQLCEEIIKEVCTKKILEDCFITLRYEAISEDETLLSKLNSVLTTEDDYIRLLDNTFYLETGIDFATINSRIKSRLIDAGFTGELVNRICYKSDNASQIVLEYLNKKNDSWKKKDLTRFLFDELTRIFMLAGFNGSYILLDEFEKIVDFQKPSERIEFAYDLRQGILEGNSQSAIHGFFMLILTMHPGTQRLILEAWEKAGINARSPLPSEDSIDSPHVILFDDIKKQDIKALIEVYLDFFRLDHNDLKRTGLYPFTEDAVNLIADVSKYNAARILKFCNLALTEFANSNSINGVDQGFVTDLISRKRKNPEEDINSSSFLNRETSPMEDALRGVKIKTQ